MDLSVRNGWLRGHINSVVKKRDGRCRQVLVNISGGMLRRPVTKVAILDIEAAGRLVDEGNADQSEVLDLHYESGDVGGDPTPLSSRSEQLCAFHLHRRIR